MAHIFRLALIGALFSLLFSLNASAAPPIIKWGYSGPGYYEPRTWLAASFDSANGACEAGIAALNAKGHGGRLQAGDSVYAADNVCFFYRPGAGAIGPLGDVFKEVGCGKGEKLEDGQCVPDGTGSGGGNNDQCKGLSEWCSDKKGFRTDFVGRGEGSDFFVMPLRILLQVPGVVDRLGSLHFLGAIKAA